MDKPQFNFESDYLLEFNNGLEEAYECLVAEVNEIQAEVLERVVNDV